MDPIPTMVITTQLARRKGEITVSTVEEIDQLISQLIIAKTGLLGAQSAIGARGAMEAAREVEAGRRASDAGAAITEQDVPLWARGGESQWRAQLPDGRTAVIDRLDDGLSFLPRVYESASDFESGPVCDGVLSAANWVAEFAELAREAEPARRTWGDIFRGNPAHPASDAHLAARTAPLAIVTQLRPDHEVIPELQKPCQEAHPTRGTLCTGKIPHPMPHADEDGETWVTERQEATL